MSSNRVTEEHFDKTKEKVYQRVIQSREEDVVETRLGYERIEKKFEELEERSKTHRQQNWEFRVFNYP